jgi:WD40 repeat protein
MVLSLSTDKHKATGLTFSPDGRFLTGGSDAIYIWELATGRPVRIRPRHDNLFAFTPDGRTLIFAGAGDAVRCWDMATGKDRRPLATQLPSFDALALSRDGRLLAGAGRSRVIHLWDMQTGKEKLVLPGHEGVARPVGFLPDGRTLLVSSMRGLHFWRVGRSPRPGTARPVHERKRLTGVYGLALVLRDGKTLLATRKGRALWLCEAGDGSPIRAMKLASDPDHLPVFSADGRTLAFGSRGVVVQQTATGKTLLHRKTSSPYPDTVGLTPDSKTVAVLGGKYDNWEVLFLDAATGNEIRRIPAPKERHLRLHLPSLLFCPKGRTLVLGSDYDYLRLWDEKAGWRLLRATGPFAFSPDAKMLATCFDWGEDSRVRLYEVATGRILHELRGHQGYLTGLVFSPDGKTLASGSTDNTVLLWDLQRLPTRSAR